MGIILNLYGKNQSAGHPVGSGDVLDEVDKEQEIGDVQEVDKEQEQHVTKVVNIKVLSTF